MLPAPTETEPAGPPHLTVVPALDGLRALAVSLVLLFHAGHLDGGFLGVDIFFALSGYLITALLLATPATPAGASLRDFWIRRARRLIPGLVVMITGTLVLVALLYGADDVRANAEEAISSLLYVSNWWTLMTPAPYLTVFQHTWSLSIEAQFYVIWPLVVVATRTAGRPAPAAAARRVLLVALGGGAVSATLMVRWHDGPDSIARVYFGTDTRATPILLGAAMAAAARLGVLTRLGPARWHALGWIAFTGVTAFVLLGRRPEDALYEGGYLVFSGLAALLVASLTMTTGALPRALSVPPLRWLGLISYGVYLWHWPVFYLLDPERAHVSGWPLFGLQCSIVLVIATASYLMVEQPVRRGRRSRAHAGIG